MAITRCPYCHAIIDETDKYCNNCGTQLLFPEDEEIEEEIPGEKIIEAEAEEKDYTVDEPEAEKRPSADGELAGDIDEELEAELKKEIEELALDEIISEEEKEGDDVTEEVILVDQIEALEGGAKEEPAGLRGKDGTAEVRAADAGVVRDEIKKEGEDGRSESQSARGTEETSKVRHDDEEGSEEETEEAEADEKDDGRMAVIQGAVGEEAPAEEETMELPASAVPAEDTGPVIEYITGDRGGEETGTPEEAASEPATFDTDELEDIGKTVELGKDKIDKFLEVLTEKQDEEHPPVERTRESTGTLPPWASTMKGAPIFPTDTSAVQSRKMTDDARPKAIKEEEVEIFPRRKDSDSTIGLPERVIQAPLPFERAASPEEQKEEEVEEEEKEEKEDVLREEILLPAGRIRPARHAVLPVREPERRGVEAAGEAEEPVSRPPFSVAAFVKSKAFDVLFVGIFWLVALWLAAFSMGMTLFEILGSMSGPMLLLYAVLVFLYFFLFKFFLGETLGDRLFGPRE